MIQSALQMHRAPTQAHAPQKRTPSAHSATHNYAHAADHSATLGIAP